MKFTFLRPGVLVAAVCLMGVGSAQAGVIISPVAVLSNSAGTTAGSPIESTINHAGLLTNFVSGVSDFDAYLALAPLHTDAWIPNEWFASSGTNSATLVYDLGATYNIARMALWNEEHSGATSISLFACATSACLAPAPLGVFAVADSPFDANYGAQVFDVTDATTRYLMAIVLGPNVPNRYNAVSMAEIAFDAAQTAVPEPAVLALLGTAAFFVRRRRARG